MNNEKQNNVRDRLWYKHNGIKIQTILTKIDIFVYIYSLLAVAGRLDFNEFNIRESRSALFCIRNSNVSLRSMKYSQELFSYTRSLFWNGMAIKLLFIKAVQCGFALQLKFLTLVNTFLLKSQSSILLTRIRHEIHEN